MYKDLAEATDALKNKGFDHHFELGKDHITCRQLDKEFEADTVVIQETHHFDQGTDPGSEATIYAIEANPDVKGTLIISYGKYIDPDKAALVDALLNAQKH